MNDSDPRPMPPEVQRAYRDPLKLDELFATDVFTNETRLQVRDELLRRLVSKHGNVEVEIGRNLVPMADAVSRFMNPWYGIDELMSAHEYGGTEAVAIDLAHIMQPHWSAWWDAFDWGERYLITRWVNIARIVLGERQFRLLSAQYGRSVIDLAPPQDREVCIKAIEASEEYSRVPSGRNGNALSIAGRSASYAAGAAAAVSNRDGSVAGAASLAAYYAVSSIAAATAGADAPSWSNPAAGAAASAASNAANAMNVASRVTAGVRLTASPSLAELTKQLITPTLITSASRGLR